MLMLSLLVLVLALWILVATISPQILGAYLSLTLSLAKILTALWSKGMSNLSPMLNASASSNLTSKPKKHWPKSLYEIAYRGQKYMKGLPKLSKPKVKLCCAPP